MLGSSPFWDHINLAYELLQAPRALSQPDEAQLDISAGRTTRLEQHKGHPKKEDEFLPGEIAHIQDDGSLIRGFYDFVTWQGLKITQEESRLRNLAKMAPAGRMCLVLQRLADGTYLICFLTSFGGTKRGENIASPLGRLFAVAIEDTEEFPKGSPSVKLSPKWRSGAFLYALPVPRKKLVRHKLAKYMPFMLGVGELERVKRLILDRIRIFRIYHERFREEEITYRKLGLYNELKTDPIISEAVDAAPELVFDEVPDADLSILAVEPMPVIGKTLDIHNPLSALGTPSGPSIPPDDLMPEKRRQPRIHYLETKPAWLNLRVLLEETTIDDICLEIPNVHPNNQPSTIHMAESRGLEASNNVLVTSPSPPAPPVVLPVKPASPDLAETIAGLQAKYKEANMEIDRLQSLLALKAKYKQAVLEAERLRTLLADTSKTTGIPPAEVPSGVKRSNYKVGYITMKSQESTYWPRPRPKIMGTNSQDIGTTVPSGITTAPEKTSNPPLEVPSGARQGDYSIGHAPVAKKGASGKQRRRQAQRERRAETRSQMLHTVSQDILATVSSRIPAQITKLHEQKQQSSQIRTSRQPASDETSGFEAQPSLFQESGYGLKPRPKPTLRDTPIRNLFQEREHALKPKPKLRNVPIHKPSGHTARIEGIHFHGHEPQPSLIRSPGQHNIPPHIASGFEAQSDRFQVGKHRPRPMPQLLDTASPDIQSTIKSFGIESFGARARLHQYATSIGRTLTRLPK